MLEGLEGKTLPGIAAIAEALILVAGGVMQVTNSRR